jgi:3-oxoacyl-[acyl-carrier-protein] synthase II
MNDRRVVVTGIGALTPIGNNLKDYWKSLVNGISGAGPITHFDASKFKTQFACEVKGFDAKEFIHTKEARKLDKFSQYALVVSDEAIKDSNIDTESINSDRAGVIWGSGIGGMETFFKESVIFATGNGTPRFNPFFYTKVNFRYSCWAYFY